MSLPSGYKRLEYIQSSGSQNINTGFSDALGFRAVIDLTFTAIVGGLNGVIGSHDTNPPYNRNFLAAQSSGWEIGAYDFWDFGSFAVNTPYNIDVSTVSGNCRTIINGTTYTQSPPSTARSNRSLYLFGFNYSGGLFLSRFILRSCKIYDHAGTLVRDYIPCKNASNVAGLWDNVNLQFYGNSGTGVFTAGPEVPTAPPTPTDFSGTWNGTFAILSWTASEGANGYRVYRNGSRYNNVPGTGTLIRQKMFQALRYGVSAYNAYGESEQAQITVSAIPDNPILYLITDRTNADVTRLKQLLAIGWDNMTAEEQAEFSASLKGAYNAEDLNRVGAAVAFIAQRLASYGYPVTVNHRQNWYTIADDSPFDPGNEPTPEAMAAYLADIATIRAALAALPTTPAVPEDMDELRYTEANDIEQILLDVDHLITNMIQSFVPCGVPYCGQFGGNA